MPTAKIEMSSTPIADMLKNINKLNNSRFCMPGHKGRKAFLNEEANRYDITELTGADNLYKPEGAIYESQNIYAEYIGAKDCFFIVNGSSCGVQASILSVLNPGDEVIAARNLHLSAIHAFALAGVIPHFVYNGSTGIGDFNIIDDSQINAAIKHYPKSKAVYLTYPDYYGRCANLTSICDACHKAGMKVICDAAHAAAFDYSKRLPVSPAEAGCDIWTASLHKTLPAMNQCAVLCTGRDGGIIRTRVQNRLNLIQTTSPSYILLASSEYALNYMRSEGKRKLEEIIDLVLITKQNIDRLGGYSCLSKESAVESGADDLDLLKLTLDVSGRGVTGFYAAAELEKAGIYVESADLKRILLICTVSDKKSDFEKLLNALGNIKNQSFTGLDINESFKPDNIFTQDLKMNIRDAVFAETERIPLNKAAGRISAVCAVTYPPGTPIIIPGQEIIFESASYIEEMQKLGYSIFGCDDNINVVKSNFESPANN